MSFFDAADQSEAAAYKRQRRVEPAWFRVPTEFVPVALPISELLASTKTVALTLSAIEVYPTGFTFTIRAALHPEVAQIDHDMVADLNQFMADRGPDRFQLGLGYADGRKATNRRLTLGGGPDAPPPEAMLRTMGGGGSADGIDARFWAWPIPEAGDLDLVFSWLVCEVDEGRFTIAGDTLRAAAAAAQPIWPPTAPAAAAPAS